MRVFFAKIVPEPDEPEVFSTGWAEAVTRDGKRLVLHNCQTCVAHMVGSTLRYRVIHLGNIRINRALISRVPAPEWFKRVVDMDQHTPLKDRTAQSLLSSGRR